MAPRMSLSTVQSPDCSESATSTSPKRNTLPVRKDSSKVCRFCLCTEGEEVYQDEQLDEFVSPCLCRGSGRSVHVGCLVQHFRARGDWHNFQCPTCKQSYEGKGLRYLALCSVAEVTEMHGKESLQVASSLFYLAESQRHLGNVTESKKLLESSLNIRERYFGKDHIETATTLAELAVACGKLGEVHCQKDLLERSLAIMEAHYGAGHIKTASALNNLSTAYAELGDVAQEHELLERCLAIKEEHFGKEHVQCVATLLNLASVYSELGDIHRGRTVLQETLIIEERHFGPGHVQTAVTLNNLALAFGETGDLQSMQEYLERSLEIKDAYYGVDHPETCLTLASLGTAYCALGEVALAKQMTQRAVIACNMGSSPKSRRNIMVFLRAAATHHALGENSKADEFVSSALHSLVELLGPISSARTLKREMARSRRIWSTAGRQDMLIWLDILACVHGINCNIQPLNRQAMDSPSSPSRNP